MGNCIVRRSHKLDNLFVIIDYNKLQGFGSTNKILNLEPLNQNFKALIGMLIKLMVIM